MRISYVPYSELVIHEIIKQDNETFFQEAVRQNIGPQGYNVPSINWYDGIAFIAMNMPPTEDVVKENLQGKVHYSAVVYTNSEFKPEMEFKVGAQTFPLRLRNAGNNPTFVELVKFLKGFKPPG